MEDWASNPLVLCVVLGVVCYFLTLITRRIVETAWPSVRSSVIPSEEAVKGTELKDERTVGATEIFHTAFARWWNQVILYVLPVFYGAVGMLLIRGSKFYPEPFRHWVVCIFVGSACGFFSGLMVKVLKKIFLDKMGITDEASLPTANNK